MRCLVLTLALVAALPASAQIVVAPLVGYDLGLDAPSLGVAAELGVPVPVVTPSVRTTAEWLLPGGDQRAVRASLSMAGRFRRVPGAILHPVVAVGANLTHRRFAGFEGDDFGATRLGAHVRIGAEFTRLFVESEVGTGAFGSLRLRAGYRF